MDPWSTGPQNGKKRGQDVERCLARSMKFSGKGDSIITKCFLIFSCRLAYFIAHII